MKKIYKHTSTIHLIRNKQINEHREAPESVAAPENKPPGTLCPDLSVSGSIDGIRGSFANVNRALYAHLATTDWNFLLNGYEDYYDMLS